MNIDELVTTAAHLHDVYAIGSETFAGPAGSKLTAVEFPDAGQSARFAAGCMADGIPARSYGPSVVLLHEATSMTGQDQRPFIAVNRPWGPIEISSYCHVARATVDQWRARGVLPGPDGTVSGRPYWRPQTIMRWANATGRWVIDGRLWRWHAHTAVWAGADGIVHGRDQAEAEQLVRSWVAQEWGVRVTGSRDDEHGHLYVRVWDADWSVPQLTRGTALEAWDCLLDETTQQPREGWWPVTLAGDVREGEDGAFVRIGDVHTTHMPWHRLRMPGSETTLAGGQTRKEDES